jgi:hypothetical protein
MEKEDKIKQIENQIEKLKEELENVKNPYKLFKDHSNCFIIENTEYNCFKTLENKQRYQRKRKIFDALANFQAENDCEVDWSQYSKKYHIEKCIEYAILKKYEPHEYIVSYTNSIVSLGTIYFSTELLAKEAIKMLKEENLI